MGEWVGEGGGDRGESRRLSVFLMTLGSEVLAREVRHLVSFE